MSVDSSRPIPLLGDIALTAVDRLEHTLEAGFKPVAVLALDGEVQQRSGRGSHRVKITGVLQGESRAEDLEALQNAAAEGEELTFAADIVNALDLQKVVITDFRAAEQAGRPFEIRYALQLVESPPLPPPAQVSAFGGLDDFGLGDLGFDTDIMGDLEDLAGDVAGAVDDALDAVAALDALANLGELGFGGELAPLEEAVDSVGEIGRNFRDAADALGGLFSS